MAYEKTTWANGDIITAAKLNNMEDGIESIIGLPSFSGANGTYLLKLTKSDDGVTYSWVAES